MTDWQGGELCLASDGSSGAGEVIAAATSELHAAAVGVLAANLQ
mgnify:CR=1